MLTYICLTHIVEHLGEGLTLTSALSVAPILRSISGPFPPRGKSLSDAGVSEGSGHLTTPQTCFRAMP